MKQIRLLVDMDGVICDLNKEVLNQLSIYRPDLYEQAPKELTKFYIEDYFDEEGKKFVNNILREPMFFAFLPEMEGAVDALNELKKEFDVFICTAPLLENSTCASDKFDWVLSHLGYEWTRKLIISKDKTVIDGDFLIDDKPEIDGIQEPIWQRIVYDAPYNKNIVGRRLNWQNYKSVLNRLW